MKTCATLLFLLISTLLFNGCKDKCESCLNGGACNGNSCDCAPGYTGDNCENAVVLSINKITLTSLPFNDPATSSNWDNSSGPDVYFVLKDGTGTVLYSHEIAAYGDLDNVDLPVEFTIATPVVVSNLDLQLLVAFYDNDNGEDFLDFDDDFIGSVEFNIHDYIEGTDAYPTEVAKENQDLHVVLGMQWGD